MWCQEPRPAIGAAVASVLRDLEPGDAKGDLDTAPINHPRLEALPFARFTVECQSQIEKQGKVTRARVPVTSLFGLTDEEPAENEEEETVSEPKE